MAADDWQESLGNIDDLISCMGNLETEDVIYLEEYLAGEGGLGSRSPSLWSALRNSTGDESASLWMAQEEGVSRQLPDKLVDEEDAENVDDPPVPPDTASGSDSVGTSLGPRQPRSTRGVPKTKFVSYQTFPATKDKPFICELCGCRLATRESRRRHIVAKHSRERNNVCSVCGKSFVFKFSLKAHAAVHSATPNFTCVCGQTFSVRGSYMNHVRRVHRAASEVKYSCELCFKSFIDHHTLRLHLISVHKPKTIPCLHSGCNKVFSTDALMKSHYWYHLKQRFPCDECGQTFSTESYMYKHRRTHSGIRPYMCVDCGKTYLSVSHLNKHRRAAHSTYRPFQCSFCGKCYKTKDQLNFHESSHRGEKPYRCEVCGYATAYRNTYYAHRKKHLSPSSGSSPQKKGKGDSSSGTGNTASGDKTSTAGKKREKIKLPKGKSPSRQKSSCGAINNNVPSLSATMSPQILELSTACGSASPGVGMSLSPATTSLSVICVVSSEPNTTINILPDVTRNTAANFPVGTESQSKDLLSSESLLSSEPLGVLQPTETDTEESYCSSQLDNKLEPYELVENSDIPEEKNFSEQTSCIILSNAAKCSVPACDGDGKSLLLFKIDEDSYVALCSTHHSLTDTTTDAEKDGTQLKESVSASLCEQVLDSPSFQGPSESSISNVTEPQDDRHTLSLEVEASEADPSESVTDSQLFAKPDVKHSREDSGLIQLISQSVATPDSCISNMPATEPLDSAKPSSEVCLSEHFSSMMELDAGIPGLSGPIVDESFSLAQIEVHCPLCEEQFLCMDDYVTHLESCHS